MLAPLSADRCLLIKDGGVTFNSNRIVIEVSNLFQFQNEIGSDRIVKIVNDIAFTEAIKIEWVTGLTIMSDVAGKAKLMGGSFGAYYGGILGIQGSGVTLKGLSFEGGEAKYGGCVSGMEGSTVVVEDVDFKECVATVGLE